MGIYDEIPGERHGSILDHYRNAASIIEASGLDYTILRPAWAEQPKRDWLRDDAKRRAFHKHHGAGIA